MTTNMTMTTETARIMTRKEKTQQKRFDTKIAPLLQEVADLCAKFDMSLLASVQLYIDDESNARIEAFVTHPQNMALPMTLSTSLMRGTTQVSVSENTLRLVIPKGEMPEELKAFTDNRYDPLQTLSDELAETNVMPFIIPKNNQIH